MNTLALVLAMGGSLLAASPAFAQQPNPGNQDNVPIVPQTAPSTSQTNCMSQGGSHRLSAQDAEQLSKEPALQQALNGFPGAAKDAIDKAASGGQLIGVSEKLRGTTTHYEADIFRNGTVFRMETDANGKIVTWSPKTH